MKRGILQVVAMGVALGLAVPAAAQLMRTDGSRFLEAVQKRDGETVMTLLSEPGSTLINARDIVSGRGALHIVVERRDLTWLKFLLQRGANANQADERGMTPLQLAAQLGFVEGVEELATSGAQLDVGDGTGETPLIAAVHRRDLPVVRILLEKGANPARTDNSGRSARDYAKLLGSGSQILDAITAAEAARASKEKTYGPK